MIHELEDISHDIFIEAKWKIIDVLKEASTKHMLRKTTQKMLINRSSTPVGQFRAISTSSASSSSVIIVPSPTNSPLSQELNPFIPFALPESPTCSSYSSSTKVDEFPRSSIFKGKTGNSEGAGT